MNTVKPHTSVTDAENDEQRRQRGKKALKIALILFVVFALIIAIAIATTAAFHGMETVEQFVANSKPWLGCWRLLLFAVVFGGWRHWSTLYARWALMSDSQLQLMIASRWRMAAWVLVIEAIFTQHVLSDFLNTVL